MRESSPHKNSWHILIGGTIGNLTEWYNFLLYGYLASAIAQLFFPDKNRLLSLTLTFTVFALSFFARPFGGMLFGWIGDKYGRKSALISSLAMMTIATLSIGCLPTYRTIGIASPILLCIFRVFQGLSAGGEDTGAAVYVAEYAPPKRRTLWVSTVPTSTALGILLSSAAALLITSSFSHEQLLSWGWRVGYWVGALFCTLGLLLRVTLPETPFFKKNKKEKPADRFPISSLINDPSQIKNLLLVFCLASSWGVFYQILFIWMPTYLLHAQHFTNSTTLKINTCFMLLFTCLIPSVGYCADYISRKFLLILFSVIMFISAYPLFVLLASGSLWQTCIAMGLFTVIFSVFISTSMVVMVESFSTQIRYTGLSIGFNLGLAIFGGTAPLIATWLIVMTKYDIAPAFYVMTFAIITLLTVIHINDKRGQII